MLSKNLYSLIFQALKRELAIKKFKKNVEKKCLKRIFNKLNKSISQKKMIKNFEKAFAKKNDINLKLKYFWAIKDYDEKIKLKKAKVQNIFEQFRRLSLVNKRRLIFNMIKNYHKILKNLKTNIHSKPIGNYLFKIYNNKID